MKISPISTNYSFKAHHSNNIEKNPYSVTGDLTHTSQFFRWDRNHNLNRTLGQYLKKQNIKEPLNVISLGCSFGEEPYSLAMTMEYYGLDSNIKGIDLSQKAIEGAMQGKYNLSGYEAGYLFADYPYNINFPPRLTEFQIGMRKSFNEKFELIDNYKRTYQKKPNTFKNCEFKQGDITNISQYFEDNSQDLIMCSMVLYHLSEKDMFSTLKQAYDILKPGGFLCVSPMEQDYSSELKYIGFNQPYPKSPWLFQKPRNNAFLGSGQLSIFLKTINN